MRVVVSSLLVVVASGYTISCTSETSKSVAAAVPQAAEKKPDAPTVPEKVTADQLAQTTIASSGAAVSCTVTEIADGSEITCGDKVVKIKHGLQGKDGAAGVDGKEGAAGVAGAEGKEGAAGVAGVDGKEGAAGVAGVDGKSCTAVRDEASITLTCGESVVQVPVQEPAKPVVNPLDGYFVASVEDALVDAYKINDSRYRRTVAVKSGSLLEHGNLTEGSNAMLFSPSLFECRSEESKDEDTVSSVPTYFTQFSFANFINQRRWSRISSLEYRIGENFYWWGASQPLPNSILGEQARLANDLSELNAEIPALETALAAAQSAQETINEKASVWSAADQLVTDKASEIASKSGEIDAKQAEIESGISLAAKTHSDLYAAAVLFAFSENDKAESEVAKAEQNEATANERVADLQAQLESDPENVTLANQLAFAQSNAQIASLAVAAAKTFSDDVSDTMKALLTDVEALASEETTPESRNDLIAAISAVDASVLGMSAAKYQDELLAVAGLESEKTDLESEKTALEEQKSDLVAARNVLDNPSKSDLDAAAAFTAAAGSALSSKNEQIASKESEIEAKNEEYTAAKAELNHLYNVGEATTLGYLRHASLSETGLALGSVRLASYYNASIVMESSQSVVEFARSEESAPSQVVTCEAAADDLINSGAQYFSSEGGEGFGPR